MRLRLRLRKRRNKSEFENFENLLNISFHRLDPRATLKRLDSLSRISSAWQLLSLSLGMIANEVLEAHLHRFSLRLWGFKLEEFLLFETKLGGNQV